MGLTVDSPAISTPTVTIVGPSFAAHELVRTHRRITENDFPDVGVSVDEIRTYFDAWADELDAR